MKKIDRIKEILINIYKSLPIWRGYGQFTFDNQSLDLLLQSCQPQTTLLLDPAKASLALLHLHDQSCKFVEGQRISHINTVLIEYK